jgi:hypothetical protein
MTPRGSSSAKVETTVKAIPRTSPIAAVTRPRDSAFARLRPLTPNTVALMPATRETRDEIKNAGNSGESRVWSAETQYHHAQTWIANAKIPRRSDAIADGFDASPGAAKGGPCGRAVSAEPSSIARIMSAPSRPDRADRIGEFCGNPKTRTFGELLIDLEEDKAARAVVWGLLREMERK